MRAGSSQFRILNRAFGTMAMTRAQQLGLLVLLGALLVYVFIRLL